MKKIIGFTIITLLIATNVYPVIGHVNMIKQPEIRDRDTVDVWTKLNPNFVGGVLYPREFVAMAYDSGADRMILFGGFSGGGNYYNDTWAYDYSTNTWFNRNPSYSGGTLSYRSSGAIPGFAYDSDNDCMILFGGDLDGGIFINETWAYNFSDNIWVNRSPAVSGGSLEPRHGVMMAYYDSVDRMIMFGGVYDAGGFDTLNETWEYNYDTNTWTKLSPTVVGGSLPRVYSGSMVYDSNADRIILIGGGDTNFTSTKYYNETWVYCYDNNTWWKRNPVFVGGTLVKRAVSGMVYDSGADLTILFGGDGDPGGGGLINDTWVYNYSENTWYKVNYIVAGDSFPGRETMGMAYDSINDRTIMACGFCQNPFLFMNDTWVFTYNYENNQAPNTPEQPTGPTNLNPDELGTYTTSATDPDSDQIQYQFDWDANGNHDHSDWTNWVSSGTEVSLSHSWSDGGSYVVKARVQDFYGNISGWSSGLTVVVNSAPNSPSDPDPIDGATDVDVNADLSWDCSDPEGDDLRFDVYFEADDPTPDELVSSNQSESWYDPGTIEYDTIYYWQIVAWDKYAASTQGPVWSFTTGSIPNDPPNPPSNPLPENGATDVDVEADIVWDCYDPDGDSLTYDIYLDIVNPPVNMVSDDQSETSFDPGTLEFLTTYYWQIIAKDEHGASTPSSVWQFTTRDNNPPGAPIIDGPTKGKPGVEYNFTFNAVDPDADYIAEYSIRWGDGTEEIIEGPFASGSSANASHTWTSQKTFTIKVTAKDIYGAESNWTYYDIKIEIPRNRATYPPVFTWFLERFPLLERLLDLIIKM